MRWLCVCLFVCFPFFLYSVPRKNQTREGGLLSDFQSWKEIEVAVTAAKNTVELEVELESEISTIVAVDNIVDLS